MFVFYSQMARGVQTRQSQRCNMLKLHVPIHKHHCTYDEISKLQCHLRLADFDAYWMKYLYFQSEIQYLNAKDDVEETIYKHRHHLDADQGTLFAYSLNGDEDFLECNGLTSIEESEDPEYIDAMSEVCETLEYCKELHIEKCSRYHQALFTHTRVLNYETRIKNLMKNTYCK